MGKLKYLALLLIFLISCVSDDAAKPVEIYSYRTVSFDLTSSENFEVVEKIRSSCSIRPNVNTAIDIPEEVDVFNSSGIPLENGGEIYISTIQQSVDEFIVSQDENFAVTIDSLNGTIKWWDLVRGCSIRYRQIKSGNIQTLRRSPSGNTFLTKTSHGNVLWWNTKTGALIYNFDFGNARIHGVEYLSERSFLFSFSNYHMITFDLESENRGIDFPDSTIGFRCLRYDQEKQILYAMDKDNHLVVWDMKEEKEIFKSSPHPMVYQGMNIDMEWFKDGSPVPVSDIVPTPDGKGVIIYSLESNYIITLEENQTWREIENGIWKSCRHLVFRRNNYAFLKAERASRNKIPYGRVEEWNLMTRLTRPMKVYEFDTDVINFVYPYKNGREILAGLENGNLAVLDLESETIKREFSESAAEGVTAQEKRAPRFFKDGEYFISVSSDSNLRIWDLRNMSLLKTIENDSNLLGLDISADGHWIAGGDDNSIYLWDGYTGERINSFAYSHGKLSEVELSPDGAWISLVFTDGSAAIRDRKSLRLHKRFPNHPESHNLTAHFSHDSSTIGVLDSSGKISLYDVEAGESISEYSFTRDNQDDFVFSRDDKSIFISEYLNSIKQIDLQEPKLSRDFVFETEDKQWQIENLCLSPDTSALLFLSSDSDEMYLLDLEKRKIINTYPVWRSEKYSFSPDNRHALTISENGRVHYLDTISGKSLIFYADGKEWIVYDEQGYFSGSFDSGEILSITKDLTNYRIDQFASSLNRPDILMEEFNLGTPDMIELYKAEYKKRLQRGNFQETPELQFDIPISSIIDHNEDDISSTLSIEFKSEKIPLSSYIIYDNNIPITGGFFDEAEQFSCLLSADIPLVKGSNKLEVSCFNTYGSESYRDFIVVENETSEKEEKLYCIGFGISEYNNDSYNLQYAAKDALDFEKAMTEELNLPVVARVYTNGEINRGTLSRANELLKEATVDDSVILFIAGHGIHGDDGEYYFPLANSDLGYLVETSIPFSDFEDWLYDLIPRNKTFFIDTCESGLLDENEDRARVAMEDTTDIRSRGYRGIKSVEAGRIKPAAYQNHLNRYIFNDLTRRSGTTVFSSCRGNELSYESSDIENGYFTEAILNGFVEHSADSDSNGILDIDELEAYVIRQVNIMTGGFQNPIIERENIYQKSSFPLKDN